MLMYGDHEITLKLRTTIYDNGEPLRSDVYKHD